MSSVARSGAGAPLAVSVVVPVLDEAASLRETVDVVLTENGDDVVEVLVIVCDRTSHEVLTTTEQLRDRYGGQRIRVVSQDLPRLGGALRSGIAAARGTHVITMFSDLESDPASVRPMIDAARLAPAAVISASRWLPGAGFEGYPAGKLLLNRFFQLAFASLFRVPVTDFSFGFRSYPLPLLRSFSWQECGHRFVLESLLRPVLDGVEVVEVPSRWRRRREGRSQVTLLTYLSYWSLGLRLWADRRSRGRVAADSHTRATGSGG